MPTHADVCRVQRWVRACDAAEHDPCMLRVLDRYAPYLCPGISVFQVVHTMEYARARLGLI